MLHSGSLGSRTVRAVPFLSLLLGKCASPFYRGDTGTPEECRVSLNQVQLIVKACNEKMGHCKIGWGQGKGGRVWQDSPVELPREGNRLRKKDLKVSTNIKGLRTLMWQLPKS